MGLIDAAKACGWPWRNFFLMAAADPKGDGLARTVNVSATTRATHASPAWSLCAPLPE